MLEIIVMSDPDYLEIEKESVTSLHFPHEEVIVNSEAQLKARAAAVERAITLGNLEHQKVKIYFMDDERKKMVHTTIWAVTDTAIVLKQNVILPINRIIKLEI